MKTIIIFMLLTCSFLPMRSQELSTMPKNKRDSILITIARETIKEFEPNYYEEYMVRKPFSLQVVIEERKITEERTDPKDCFYGHKPGDIWYKVTFPYENWKVEKFEWDYLAKVFISNKNAQPILYWLGISGMFRNIRMDKAQNSQKNH